MKRFPQKELRFDEKELNQDLGAGNFIFVCSGTDMFAHDVDRVWIASVMDQIDLYPDNKYLLQSKNPERFFNFRRRANFVYGTTIETNREYDISKAPHVQKRASAMSYFSEYTTKMVTIEPVMDFDLEPLVELVKQCAPAWVNIGADSKGHDLPEPDAAKIQELYDELRRFTEVKLKDNLKRLYR
jgi:protein gp37